MRSVSLLGSTGSIGTQAVDVLQGAPERFRVTALAAQSSVELLLAQAALLRSGAGGHRGSVPLCGGP